MTVRLAVLLSGSGSNFQALADAIRQGEIPDVEITLVMSNKANAYGLERAKALGISALAVSQKTFLTAEDFDAELLRHLKAAKVDVVVLAGYLKILTPVLIEAYPGRILNIHPSLLPAFGGKGMYGLKVHEAVLTSGVSETGCSVHLVTSGVDEGPVLASSKVAVLPGDTPETLAARVLMQEHRLLPQTLKLFLQNEFPRMDKEKSR